MKYFIWYKVILFYSYFIILILDIYTAVKNWGHLEMGALAQILPKLIVSTMHHDADEDVSVSVQ